MKGMCYFESCGLLIGSGTCVLFHLRAESFTLDASKAEVSQKSDGVLRRRPDELNQTSQY